MERLRSPIIKVFVVDDHDFIQRGIREFLSTRGNIQIIGTAANGQEAIVGIKSLHPDIVVMDIMLKGEMNGFQTTMKLQEEGLNVGVIILTLIDDDENYIEQFTTSGAQGYVLKQNSPEELYTAIESVYKGHSFLSPSVARAVLSFLKGRNIEDESLTEAELKIAKLTALGHKTKEIAQRLSMSPRTVEKHREHIERKWNIHNIADIARVVVKRGLIP